ncbi:MAG: serpin family protein [Bacteroidales bacterium]|nr:serpin family protein [Bacteroidales bacterium]
MKKALLLTFVMMTVAFNSCGKISSDNDIENEEPKERKDIALTRSQIQLVSSGNTLACNMLKIIASQHSESFIFSPISLEYALAMVNNGAAGETENQIRDVIGFGDRSVKEVNEFYKYLTENLLNVDNTVAMNIANAQVFNTAIGDESKYNKDYKNALTGYYNALFEGYDFAKDNKKALSAINSWASKQTEGMINPLLDELDPYSATLLMNAIYFKGSWADKFDSSFTRKEDFTKGDGAKTKVDMMNQTSNVSYYFDKNCSAISKTYGNGAFKMTFILPDEGITTAELAKGLDRTALERIIKRKGSEEVIIKIPKFETSFTIELNDMLKSLGMVDAFNPTKADFSSMSSHLSLYISRVLQKARIKVEEKGTEAAAVTVIDMKLTSAIPSPGEPLTFYATRPFLYTISEVSTGAILFMGQYNGD